MTSIRPFTKNDVPAVVELIHWSKLSLTINRLLWNNWPNVESQKWQVTQAVEGSLRDPEIKCLSAIDDESGQIVGLVVLTPRLSKKASQTNESSDQSEAKEPPKLSENLNPAVLSMVIDTVGGLGKGMTGTDHIEITSLTVDPLFRRRGIGRQLMDRAFEFAEAKGLPLFTASEPAGLIFFEKLGLWELDHADMDLSRYASPYEGFGLFRLTAMLWDPSL